MVNGIWMGYYWNIGSYPSVSSSKAGRDTSDRYDIYVCIYIYIHGKNMEVNGELSSKPCVDLTTG